MGLSCSLSDLHIQTVPRREENRLARQRLAENLGQVESFGELERALEVRRGEIELLVEDEEASELRRDRGPSRSLPFSPRSGRAAPSHRPRWRTSSKGGGGREGRERGGRLEPNPPEEGV